jgi:hypothetical protein
MKANVLHDNAENLFKIVSAFEKLMYKDLSMGIKMAPYDFQNVIYNLVQDTKYVKTNLDISDTDKKSYIEHLLERHQS